MIKAPRLIAKVFSLLICHLCQLHLLLLVLSYLKPRISWIFMLGVLAYRHHPLPYLQLFYLVSHLFYLHPIHQIYLQLMKLLYQLPFSCFYWVFAQISENHHLSLEVYLYLTCPLLFLVTINPFYYLLLVKLAQKQMASSHSQWVWSELSPSYSHLSSFSSQQLLIYSYPYLLHLNWSPK